MICFHLTRHIKYLGGMDIQDPAWPRVVAIMVGLVIVFLVDPIDSAGGDNSFCTPKINASGPPLPDLGASFEARLEWKLLQSATWFYVDEVYHAPSNMAALQITGYPHPGITSLFISDYTNKQYITIQSGSCSVASLEAGSMFALPFTQGNDTDHVMSVQDVLNFGRRYNESFLGNATVRNISALVWNSCFYNDHLGATLDVTYYFSDGQWTSPSGPGHVPLRNLIRSRIQLPDGGFLDSVREVDFLYFAQNVTDLSVFQSAAGVYCPGRTNSLQPPRVPIHFSFRSEILFPRSGEIGALDQWYDFDAKIVRIDSKPMSGLGSENLLPRQEIHDFSAGVSYLVDMVSGRCNIVPLSVDSLDTKLVDASHVAIKSPQEFFSFQSGNFVYSGQRTERGVTMDTWIGTRTNYPPGLNQTSVWEWYFSSMNWLVSQFGPLETQVPMRLKITFPTLNQSFVYNIYDFSREKPDNTKFDVSFCYENRDIRSFEIVIQGNIGAVSTQPRDFQHSITRSLVIAMSISQLRVQKMQVDFGQTVATVQFVLLGVPPYAGDVISPAVSVTSGQAYQALKAIVDAGKFKFEVTVANMPYRFSAKPLSLKEVTGLVNGTAVINCLDQLSSRASAGWTSESVAGLAIGMSLVGLILGTVATLCGMRIKRREQREDALKLQADY